MDNKYITVRREERHFKSTLGKPSVIMVTVLALTELGERYLKRRYPDTRNEVICEKLGLSISSLMRMVKARGYKKSRAYWSALGKNASLEAEKWYGNLSKEERDAYDEMRRNAVIKGGEAYRFGTKKGERNRIKALKRRHEWEPKRTETFLETRRKDKARVLFGLEQKTKFRYKFTDDEVKYLKASRMRSSLRSHGCIIARGSFAVYNHEGVSRTQRANAVAKGFIFK